MIHIINNGIQDFIFIFCYNTIPEKYEYCLLGGLHVANTTELNTVMEHCQMLAQHPNVVADVVYLPSFKNLFPEDVFGVS